MKQEVLDYKIENTKLRVLFCGGICALFLLVLMYFSGNLDGLMNIKRKLVWCGLYAAVLLAVLVYFAVRRRVKDVWLLCAAGIAVGGAIGVRLMLFDHASGDYIAFIDHWIRQIRELPGLEGWVKKIGDYNMPYLYMLTFVAKTGGFELYKVKTFSVLADFALAYFIMRLAGLKLKSVKGEIAVFCLALFIPTVIYNGAYWGQCDSIYAAFSFAFLYYALTKRPWLSCIMLGLAVSFKLQAVFLFPMLIAFIIVKRIKPLHLLAVPAAFILTLLPAVFAGRSLYDTFSIYFVQASKNEKLTLNAPYVYQFVQGVELSSFTTATIILTGAALLCLLYVVYIKRDRMDREILVRTAFLCSLIVPMFLPQMHERYFFLADCLSLLIPVLVKDRIFVPIAVVYCSFRAYASFEMNDPSVNLRLLAVIMILTMVICTYDFINDLKRKEAVK
ncbi:MAG: DUF2029 domain-containing protein [Clostridia bacterium]|nr:DUF2029 domain-containing protein [Clostridia bacterium]